MRDQVLAGIRELSAKIAAQYGTSAEVCFTRGCPSAVTDHDLNQQLIRTITNCYGPSSFMDIERLIPGGRLPGSEDFSFITHEVPSTLAFLAAGCSDEGYVHPAHNPKTAYTDEVLYRGAAVYASFAIDWLNSTTIYE